MLRLPGAAAVVVLCLLVGAMVSGVEIALVGYLGVRSQLELLGPYTGCIAVGSMVGGLLFGAYAVPLPSRLQALLLLLAVDAGLLLVAAVVDQPAVLPGVLVLVGGSGAPLYTLLSLALVRISGELGAAEAYTAFVTAALAGGSVGAATVGAVGDADGGHGGLAVAAAIAAVAAGWAVAVRWDPPEPAVTASSGSTAEPSGSVGESAAPSGPAGESAAPSGPAGESVEQSGGQRR